MKTMINSLQDSRSEINRIGKFLEVSTEDNLISGISALCSFNAMKNDKRSCEDVKEWKNNRPGMYRNGNCI